MSDRSIRVTCLTLALGATVGCGAGSAQPDASATGDANHDAFFHYESGTLDGSVDNPPDVVTDVGDGSCGVSTFAVRPVAPNVLVVLDRSCSMRLTPTGDTASGVATSKWGIAVATLQDLTTTYGSRVRWGLLYLPRSGTAADGVACGATPVCGGTTSCPEVAPGASHGDDVMNVLEMISPFDGCGHGTQVGITPLADALSAAADVHQLRDATRSDAVLLVTDGKETCLGNDVDMVASQLATRVASLASMGVRTGVVGFGAAGTDGVNPTELNAMAAAGGLAATGATQYYAATDAASLHAAFDSLLASTLSCTFTLTSAVDDPTLLHVYVNGAATELPHDPAHANGWDYDPATRAVTLYGTTCDEVHHDRLTQLDVEQSCPGQAPPPPSHACHIVGQACDTDADCCGVRGFACDTAMHLCVVAPG